MFVVCVFTQSLLSSLAVFFNPFRVEAIANMGRFIGLSVI